MIWILAEDDYFYVINGATVKCRKNLACWREDGMCGIFTSDPLGKCAKIWLVPFVSQKLMP